MSVNRPENGEPHVIDAPGESLAPRPDSFVRDRAGRFGQGNQGGGRKRMPPEIREMLEAKSAHAATRLIEALDATKVVHYMGTEVGTYVDHEMRTRAALALYERLYGKTPQAIEVDGENGAAPIGLVFLPARGGDNGA